MAAAIGKADPKETGAPGPVATPAVWWSWRGPLSGEIGHPWPERLLRVLVPVDVVGVDPGVSGWAGEALERERHDQVADPDAQRVADGFGCADAVGVGDD